MKKRFIILFTALFICTAIQSAHAQDNSIKQDQPLFKLENIKAITDGKKRFTYPKWSPDGKKIAYSSTGGRGIWIMDADGTNIKQITNENESGWRFKWLKDSNKIAFTSTGNNKVTIRVKSRYLKIADIKKGNIKTLMAARYLASPKISTDGLIWGYDKTLKKSQLFDDNGEIFNGIKSEKVVYNSGGQKGQLLISDFDGANFKPLTPEGKRYLFHVPSTDNLKILCHPIGIDGFDIIDVISGQIKEFRNNGYSSNGSWSPDSKYIIYPITDDDGHFIIASDLYVIGADGKGKTQLTFTKDIFEMNPDWSKDGNKIVFCTERNGKIYVAYIIKVN